MTVGEALLLDEMFSPTLAETLCANGHDVLAVASHPVLRSAPDPEIAAWAARQGCRIVTENVRDFVPLAGHGEPPLRVLFTSSRRFPRSRHNPGPLLKALQDWLESSTPHPPTAWLR